MCRLRMPAVACLLVAIFGPLAGRLCPSVAMSLPAGRAYELVSPAQKSGGVGGVFPLGSLTHSLEQFGRPLQSSPDGNAIAYLGEDFYQPRLGSLNQYLSHYSPEGWLTQNLTPGVPATQESAIEANLDVGFSPDLSVSAFSGVTPMIEGALGGYANLYLASGTAIQPLVTNKPPNRTSETFGFGNHTTAPIERHLRFAGGNSGTGAARPFSHLLFEANDALTHDAGDGGERANNLYEWVNGSLRLINILPDGTTNSNASFGINYNDEYNTVQLPSLSHVISADGTRIFWTDETNGNLYVREDDDRTVQVDAAVGGGAQFQTASADGEEVIFIKNGGLYEFNTVNETTSEIVDSGVLGLVGTSENLSSIYLVAEGILAIGSTAGQPNLYLFHDGTFSFVATLSPATVHPNDNEVPDLYGTIVPYGDWYRTFAGRTARVSPSGRFVAFVSINSLTGYNNIDAHTSARDYEVFIYDAAKGTLRCASCNTDGSQPTSSTRLPAPVNGFYQQDYLDDAGRLFFSTDDPVLPQDTNEASDVYEYDEGGVHLISPGDVRDEAVFADASESGDDVFFTTRQQLVPGDQDQIVDLYNARINGRREEPPLPPCEGEACRRLLDAPASFAAPISTVFTGSANAAASAPSSTQHQGKKGAKTKKKHKRVSKRRRRAKKSGRAKKSNVQLPRGARR